MLALLKGWGRTAIEGRFYQMVFISFLFSCLTSSLVARLLATHIFSVTALPIPSSWECTMWMHDSIISR